jgi:hypothetical protein
MARFVIPLGWIFLLAVGGLFADPIVRNSRVTSEERGGHNWINLTGEAEEWVDLPMESLLAVLTDWSSYPRFFRQIVQAEPEGAGAEFLLHETTSVPVLGVSVVNRFVLRMQWGMADGNGFMHWTQEATDGTIDHLVGGWDLIPTIRNGRSGTLILYRNASSVKEVLPGQALVVGLFYPGALKDAVTSVVTEARRKKE